MLKGWRIFAEYNLCQLDEKNAIPALNESGALQYPPCGVYQLIMHYETGQTGIFPNFPQSWRHNTTAECISGISNFCLD
jgi:hypothetical protein